MTQVTAESSRRAVTDYEIFLTRLRWLPGAAGRSVRRKLRRSIGRRAIQWFEASAATLKPGDICLDIGANVGTFTDLLSRTGAEVHAFEPDPETFAGLQARYGDRPNVHLHQAAVGARAGTVRLRRLRDFAKDPLTKSQASSIVFKDAARFEAEGVEVTCHAFRDVVNGFDRPCKLVKIDIEGAEFDLLEEVFTDPDAFAFAQMFVETHERFDAAKGPLIDRLLTEAPTLQSRYVNLYWF